MKKLPVTILIVACMVLLLDVRPSFGLPLVKRTVLDNGLVLLVSEEHSLPFVSMLLLVKAGSKDDPPGQEGVADLTASALLLGAAGRRVEQINEDLDYMGASLNAGANRDFTTVGLRVLTKDIKRAFPILMDVLAKPTFPANELKNEVSRILGAIRSQEDEPGVVAQKAFERTLYMNGPYGHLPEGTKESVEKLDREKVIRFHRSHYHPGNAILVVVGDIDERTTRDYLIPALQRWPKKAASYTAAQNRFVEEKKIVRINKPLSQSNILIGNPAMHRENPDYYAAVVLNHILGGGGLRSRLMKDIRIEKGLAYSVDSGFDAGKLAGSFQISLQTKRESTEEAITAVMSNIERIRNELVSEQELADAKSYLVGSFPQKLSNQSMIASFFSQVEYYGLGLRYPEEYPGLINSISREDVLRVARTYLLPDRFVTVVVGNAE